MRAVFALLVATLLAGAARAETGSARVTYVTTSTVYVDAGSEAGLARGSELTVSRGGEVVATLVVSELASKRAACPVPDGAPVRVGDTVTFAKRVRPSTAPAPDTPAASLEGRTTRSSARTARWRGRFGVRFFGILDQSDLGQNYYQPSFDVRLDGSTVLHRHLSVSVDARTQRTYRSVAGEETTSTGRARVYRALARWHPATSAWSVTAGRQQSIWLSTVGLFDGLAVEYRGRDWVGGTFAGTQPDPSNLGFSDDIREAGVFAGLDRARGPSHRLRLTLAAIGSYAGSEINRENLAIQAIFRQGRLNGSAIQEIDVNREWKSRDESRLAPTSTFLTLGFAATERLGLDGGFDNRRNLRLYRHRVTPETEFDDAYRQGYWAGLRLRLAARVRARLDFRGSSGGTSGRATSTTGRVSGRLPGIPADVTLRSTRYWNPRLSGWLHSASARVQLGSRLGTEIDGGIRREEAGLANAGDTRLTWVSLDVDYRLSSPWYLIVSVERSHGDREENTQVYSSAVYRF